MKCANFSCKGLGDGLISLILSNNLFLNGHEVLTYHPNLHQLQSHFPHLPIKKEFPSFDEVFNKFDQIFVSYDASSSYILGLIKEGKKRKTQNFYVLNPSQARKVGSQPFYEDALFDPSICMTINLQNFCKNILKLKKTTKENGITFPKIEKNPRRIIIHPTSAKRSKNWYPKRYVKLAMQLKKIGFDPVFVMQQSEAINWQFLREMDLLVKGFSHLKDLLEFISSARLMIGNDSGIGHLASCLHIPTITLFRHHRSSKLWRPGWEKGEVLYPAKWIPNLSFFRLRDKKWQSFISTKKVINTSISLMGDMDYFAVTR